MNKNKNKRIASRANLYLISYQARSDPNETATFYSSGISWMENQLSRRNGSNPQTENGERLQSCQIYIPRALTFAENGHLNNGKLIE